MTTNATSAPISVAAELAELVDQAIARVKARDTVGLDELIRNHPEHADELQRLLPAVQVMADLSRSGEPGTSVTGGFLDPLGELGDFRIIREVGHGGMGVVYEAEQISLGRRVALKVLPFAATMDPKQLQRFRNEAKAAASLHHEHVVPVFGVGCERGVHYYAMQFIDGTTLADVIAEINNARELNHRGTEDTEKKEKTGPKSSLCSLCLCGNKSSFFRGVSETIADAADALEYAHSMGIVHRDVKPGNLMVDAAGKLWVADFGLARFGADAGLTMTGDLLGTLRYMAPEQALARHGLADHRVDVYGLGCTLYELLTGRPAVGGADKAEILRHIAFEEPVPPRKLDKAIPAELETISLKCLAQNPNERYATAAEMAADLRQWLGDKPIKAKPPSIGQRLNRWTRRHRGLVAASLVILMLAVIGSSIGTLLIWQKDREIQRAYENENSERIRAQADLQTARAAIDQMLTRLGRDRLANVPQMENVRAEVLQDAAKFYERLLRDHDIDPAVRAELAKVYGLAAANLDLLGRKPESQTASRGCIRMYEELANEYPANAWYRNELAGALNDLGTFLQRADRLAEAEQLFGQAIARQEALVRDDPRNARYRVFLANMLSNQAQVFNDMHQFVPAEQPMRRAIALREGLVSEFPDDEADRHNLSCDQWRLGHVLNSLGRYREAEQAIQPAIATQEKLTADRPSNADYRLSLAISLKEEAELLSAGDRLPEAEIFYKKALQHYQKLAADFPRTPIYRSQTGHTLRGLGYVLTALRRPTAASDSHGQALAIFESLGAEFPQQLRYGHYVAITLHDLVPSMRLPEQLSAAVGALRKAIALEEKLVAAFPQDPEYRPFLAELLNDLAWMLATSPDVNARNPRQAVELAQRAMANSTTDGALHNTLGVAFYRAGNWKDSVAELEKSIEIDKTGGPVDWFFLAMAHWQLGDHERARKYYAQALEWMESKKSQDEELGRFQVEAAELLGVKAGEGNQPGAEPRRKP